MKKGDVENLVEAYGWTQIPSKNYFMISFRKEESVGRMNFYFTTGTLTVQLPNKPCVTIRNIDSVDMLENILLNLQ